MAQEIELGAATVRIEVGDGFVVLSGRVRLYAHKLIFEKIAWHTGGVEDVDNEIRVTPLAPLDDEAIERKIREIIKAHSRFHGSGAKIRVENGAVFISATFQHPRDDLFFELRKLTSNLDQLMQAGHWCDGGAVSGVGCRPGCRDMPLCAPHDGRQSESY